ncbi:bidirectional amino acid transporter 1, partial [Striga asiatica]
PGLSDPESLPRKKSLLLSSPGVCKRSTYMYGMAIHLLWNLRISTRCGTKSPEPLVPPFHRSTVNEPPFRGVWLTRGLTEPESHDRTASRFPRFVFLVEWKKVFQRYPWLKLFLADF